MIFPRRSVFPGKPDFPLNVISIREESFESSCNFSTRPPFGPPAYRTVAPGSSPPANGKYARYVVAEPPNAPVNAKIVPTSTAPAIKTKIPTMACSRFDSIAHLSPRRSTARAVIFRQHLQIVQLLRNFRLGNAVQKLPHPRLRARTHFFRGTDGHHVPLIDQHHAVGDQESAGEFMRDHDDRHVKRALELQDRSEERRVGKECRSRWSPYH